MRRPQPSAEEHGWEFKARFRKRAFGWQSQPAIARVKQAVSEIKKVAKKDPIVAAEGAIVLIERISPALEQVDGSSGSMGATVNNAIATLVPIIAGASIDDVTREAWLTRLFAAHEADHVPWIERLTDYWGELCAAKAVASAWADKLLPQTRMSLTPNVERRPFFHGTSACLSALFAAERFDELITLLDVDRTIWDYKQWAAKALLVQGKKAEALRYAEKENERGGDLRIAWFCEELLLSSGMIDEAYARYGLSANQTGTYVGTLHAILKKYPHKQPKDVLADLVASTPGQEGKWFTAAKDIGLYDEAIALARRSPCEPRTLARAATDFVAEQPAFAFEAAMLAMHWLVQGFGYKLERDDVKDVYRAVMGVSRRVGRSTEVKARICELAATAHKLSTVRKVLEEELAR